MKKIIGLILLSLGGFTSFIFGENFGADGALNESNYTLEEMLEYAIEDEYLALNEYEALIEKFGPIKPFTNIIESEKTHIAYLKELYSSYNIEIPKVDTTSHLYIPKNVEEAAKIGVDAEVKNIAMYNKFLKEDLPLDVRNVFEFLKKASENHLKAFRRQLER
ncbi:ferritin-like domain-containing protein [Thiospirochaeta perfilievii]|nr:DUF2202 domain-containing protein [Thiospirochaeta perfilievii]